MDATSFSDTLRAAHAQTWSRSVSHRFVSALWAGTVPDRVLAHYLTQDYMFVDAFVSLMGAAVAFADQPAARIKIARQLGMIANDEDGYFVRALKRLNPTAIALSPSTSSDTAAAACQAPTVDTATGAGVAATEKPIPTTPSAPTAAFIKLMLDSRASYAEALTVLLVAEWLYLDWASRPSQTPSDWVHAEWIELHRGQAFEDWVKLLRDEVDRVAKETGEETRRKMEEVFAKAVELELAFFEAAYEV